MSNYTDAIANLKACVVANRNALKVLDVDSTLASATTVAGSLAELVMARRALIDLGEVNGDDGSIVSLQSKVSASLAELRLALNQVVTKANGG